MLRRLCLVLATIAILPTVASAQKGQQIFDLFLQGAQQEILRQQQREFERHQRQELYRLQQQFVAQWQACHAGDVAACDAALSYSTINFADRQTLLARRAQIVAAQHEAAERVRQQRLDAELEERRRQREQLDAAERERARDWARQQMEAERQQQRAEQAERERRETERLLAVRVEQEREKANILAWAKAALVALGMAGGLVVVGIALLRSKTVKGRLLLAWTAIVAFVRRRRVPIQPAIEDDKDVLTSEAKPATPPPSPEEKPRDTPGALAALELALAYIEEVRVADRPKLDDTGERKRQLNTLSLAAKQLDLAQKLDPDAILEAQVDDTGYRYSVNELKSEALLLEGMTHQVYDIRRAIPALIAATELDPKSPRAFYVLGLTYAANMSKAKAVAALEQAIALDPKNITYRKELNRAQSLSAAEVVAYRATRAGERIFDAGVATANTGIMAWNIFAVIWNILTFPLRVVFGIFRFFRLAGFH